MRTIAGLVATVLLLLTFSGCVGDDAPLRSQGGRARVQQAPQTEAEGWHLHDYWNGTTTKRLLERNTSGGASGGGQSRFWGSMPPGALVIAGTAELRVLLYVNFTGASPRSSLEFRTPGETEWKGAALVPGVPTSVIVLPNWTDAPHTYVSAWTIGLGFQGNGSGNFQFSAHLIVDIVRQSGALDRDPPHPDHWLGETQQQLFAADGTLNQITLISLAAFNFGQPPTSVQPMKPVPEFTKTLSVTLHYNSSTPTELHYRPTIRVAAANREVLALDAPPTSQQLGASGWYRWELSPVATQWDSPYIEQSHWVIQCRWGSDLVPGLPVQGIVVRPYAMQGDYHLVVDVARA